MNYMKFQNHRVKLFNLNRELIAITTGFTWQLAPFCNKKYCM